LRLEAADHPHTAALVQEARALLRCCVVAG